MFECSVGENVCMCVISHRCAHVQMYSLPVNCLELSEIPCQSVLVGESTFVATCLHL